MSIFPDGIYPLRVWNDDAMIFYDVLLTLEKRESIQKAWLKNKCTWVGRKSRGGPKGGGGGQKKECSLHRRTMQSLRTDGFRGMWQRKMSRHAGVGVFASSCFSCARSLENNDTYYWTRRIMERCCVPVIIPYKVCHSGRKFNKDPATVNALWPERFDVVGMPFQSKTASRRNPFRHSGSSRLWVLIDEVPSQEKKKNRLKFTSASEGSGVIDKVGLLTSLICISDSFSLFRSLASHNRSWVGP